MTLRQRTLAVTIGLLLCAAPTAALAADETAPATEAAGEQVATETSPEYEAIDWVIESGLRQPHMRGAEVAVVVQSAETGSVLYERNADTPMIPASNMKVVTGAAALAVLGPDYRFDTKLYADGVVSGPVLDGNLCVVGFGDPSLVSEELWKLAESVRVLGITRVTEDLVLDASIFDSMSTTSETVASGDRAYHARTGALSLNFNAIAVHTTPGPSSGDPAFVTLAPATAFVELRNETTTGGPRSSSTLSVRRTFEDGKNVVTVSGRVPAGSGMRVHYRSLEDGLGYFGTVFKEFLAYAGVVVEGDVRAGELPEGSILIKRHESKPLSLIVRDLNKFSNNFVAEQLVKAMGLEVHGRPGTTEAGVRVLHEHVRTAGALEGSFHIEDGSGFSRENRMTVRALAAVIQGALDDFSTSYEFVASLSVSGTDGTLEDRMGYAELRQSVRAKTGLLDGVTAISGVMENGSGDEVVFSMIVNGYECEAWRVHDFEHSILAVIGRS